MHLRQLRTFVSVASLLSFTRAAGEVHLSQSTVTEQIQALETELDAQLFDRSGRKLRLTEAGRCLLPYAERLFALESEARRVVADAATPGSSLALGTLETLGARWLPEPLERFRQAVPGVSLRVDVAGSHELLARVRQGELDACAVFEPEDVAGLSSTLAGSNELVVIAPAHHRWKWQRAVAPDDLRGEAFFITPKGCVYRRIFDQACAEPGMDLTIAGEFESLATIAAMVGQGGGCALLPRIAVPPEGQQLIVRPWRGRERSASIHLVRRPQAVPSIALQTLISLLSSSQPSHQPVAAVDV